MNQELAKPVGNEAGPKPWWQRPYRMIQTNLRQPDALYDQRRLAREVKAFGADVLLYNIGGIYAFYPTKLPLQAVNPYMQGDALGAAVEAAHAEGLSLVGRFDISKATRLAYEAHPEWFVHNEKGEPLEYNGTYRPSTPAGTMTTPSRSSRNRWASTTSTASSSTCSATGTRPIPASISVSACRMPAAALPRALRPRPAEEGGFLRPSLPRLPRFRRMDDARPAAAYLRPHQAGEPQGGDDRALGASSDLIRLETQRAVDRPQPEWPYQAGEQAKWGRAYGKDKLVSSTSANFIDFAWRFASETGAYQQLRAAQQLANGATLDYYLLGVMDQDDKKAFDQLSMSSTGKGARGRLCRAALAARVGLYHSLKQGVYRGATRTRDLGQAPFAAPTACWPKPAFRSICATRTPNPTMPRRCCSATTPSSSPMSG